MSDILMPERAPHAETPPAQRESSGAANAPADWASRGSTPAAVGSAAALLSACGGGGDEAPGTPIDPTIPGLDASAFAYPQASTDADAARFLQQAQFSSSPQELTAVRSNGYAHWLGTQMATPPGQTGWTWLEARGYAAVDTNRYYANIYPADYMIWSQLLSGADGVRRRLALALSEFFVVSMSSANMNWRSHVFAHYWDTLTRHACGNFRQLLEDVSLHPAMGFFLNTKGNLKEDVAKKRVPDENYAREVMQLFSIGLYQLHLDGTVKTDGGGVPLESYTQADVTNLARVFTGYDYDTTDGVRLAVPGSTSTIESRDYARKPMRLDPAKHSTLEATFLGTTIPANTAGSAALQTALDTLFNHPNVGPFFARQMIQRLVTSQPSPAYVARVAARFNDNGLGVRGDLRAVWAAILLDDEARGPQSLADTGFGKLREPMVRLMQWARGFDARSAAGSWKVADLSNTASQLGQSPLRAPSVFNYFRPGYVPPSTDLATAQATAPEFQLVNETTVGGWMNYMQTVIRTGIRVGDPGVPQNSSSASVYDITPNYARELALVTDAVALVDHVSLVLTAGQLSASTKALMVTALNDIAPTTDAKKLDRVAAAIFMTMASAEFLVQK